MLGCAHVDMGSISIHGCLNAALRVHFVGFASSRSIGCDVMRLAFVREEVLSDVKRLE